MKYFFYRGSHRNFGDELNEYLLPKILPDFFDEDESELFLGIGSILFDWHPAAAKKIVFGCGYGGYTPLPKLDSSWQVYNVRGPRTAAALGLPADKAVADLAVMINRWRDPAPQKRHRVAFMPHWESLLRGAWEGAAAEAGVYLIDPRRSVEEVLEEMQASELIIAEAMHGAIVADALRVPWVAMLPLDHHHHFKWHDWAEALDIELKPNRLAASSLYEMAETFSIGGRTGRSLVRPHRATLERLGAGLFRRRAARSLEAAARTTPQLSSDRALDRALDRFDSDIQLLRRDYHRMYA